MISKSRLRHLVCPKHQRALEFQGDYRGLYLLEGELLCSDCEQPWNVSQGIPRLFEGDAIRGSDRWMRWIYDALASWHDPAVKYLVPLVQDCSEEVTRERYISRLELEKLDEEVPHGPIRILEVGVGTGANIPLVYSRIRDARRVEYWGFDISTGMLSRCLSRVRKQKFRRVRLLMADAHAIPFREGTFHRVFHVGGIAAFREKSTALKEMARVSKAGTPIVIVDEQYDPALGSEWWRRLVFRTVTFFDDHPHAPVEHLPRNSSHISREQIAGFFYCLTFRKAA